VDLVVFSSGSRLPFDPDHRGGSEPCSPSGPTILDKTKDPLLDEKKSLIALGIKVNFDSVFEEFQADHQLEVDGNLTPSIDRAKVTSMSCRYAPCSPCSRKFRTL
jgi:hypothetical protein